MLMCILVSQKVNKRPYKLITNISEETLMIIGIHQIMLYPLLQYFNTNIPLISKLIISCIVLISFYYPIILCKNKCPILIGKINFKK